jgi:hypothetical protein
MSDGLAGAPELRPGMRGVLTVLHGQAIDWHVEDAEWEAALTLATKERVLPWFLSQLEGTSVAVSPHIQALLTQAQHENAIEAFFWTSELKGLLQAFHEDDLPVIPLKGPALAERIYRNSSGIGGATRRTCRDLDLLVQGHDFARAQSLLGRLGFVFAEQNSYQQHWIRGAMMVELHRDVADPRSFDFHIEGAWRQARPMNFHGIPAWQFSPEDEYLFLCLHAVRDEFSRLGVVLDVALATRLLSGSAERRFRPEVEKLYRHAVLGYSIAKQFFPQLCAQVPLLEDPKVVHALKPLAAYLTNNLLIQENTYLSWAVRQRLHAQLEPSGWYRFRLRCKHVWQMFRHVWVADLAERDFAFADRWGLTRPWQVRVVRPFRLIGSILLP